MTIARLMCLLLMAGTLLAQDRKKLLVIGEEKGYRHEAVSHAMVTIEKVYGTVFENILGEKVSTKPVQINEPFSWLDRAGNKRAR